MLQQEKPDDFVIATGRMESVRRFVEICALKLNWNSKSNEPGIIWKGKGVDEIGIRKDTNEVVVRIDPRYFRPSEVDQLVGDPSKAFKKLGWTPETTLEEMIEEMIENDIKKAMEEQILTKNGLKIHNEIE